MTPKQQTFETQAKTILKNFEKRGIEGYYFPDGAACLQKILELMPEGASVANGGSMTAEEIGLMDAVKGGGYTYIDRMSGSTPEERRLMHSQVVAADYYIMSSNAITLDGELVNIDGAGNRLSCLLHGPKYVIIVAGMNKVVSDTHAAFKRVKNTAAPMNTQRLHKNTPCHETGRCGDCYSPDCICSNTVITRRSGTPGRIKVFLIGEELGY